MWEKQAKKWDIKNKASEKNNNFLANLWWIFFWGNFIYRMVF